jgi:hypothetical protein
MTGLSSAVTGKFSDSPVIMTGITSRFISRPALNDCGSRKSRLPKLGLIVLGPLSGRRKFGSARSGL